MLALTKNDAIPRPTPCVFLNCSLRRSRSAMRALMSISLNVVSIAAVCCAVTRLRAMVRRRFDIRSRTSTRSPLVAIGRAVIGAGGAAAAEAAGGPAVAGAGWACARKLWTSCFTTRPASPLGLTLARSTLCCSATFRAVGVARSLAASVSACAGGAAAEGAGVVAEGGAAATVSPDDASRMARTSPTFTSSPSCLRICASTPAFSALTSRSTFSVSRSTSASPAAT